MEKNKLFSVRGNILQKSYFLQKKKKPFKKEKFLHPLKSETSTVINP